MKMNVERLKAVAKPASAEAVKDAEARRQNRDWQEKSALIALDIHAYLRKNGISKKEFAKLMGVTPAQVTKLLSGKENLGLKTISKLENVLQMDLVTIPNYEHHSMPQTSFAPMLVCEDANCSE